MSYYCQNMFIMLLALKKIGVAAHYLLLGVSIFNESDYGLRFVTIYHIVKKNTVA